MSSQVSGTAKAMSRIGITLLCVLALPAAAATSAAERAYYIWYDARGIPTYSQTRPANQEAQQHALPEAANPGPPIRSGGEADEQAQIDPAPPGQTDEYVEHMDEVSAQARALNCRIGQTAVAQLNRFQKVFARGQDGLWRQMNAEQRAARVAKNQKLIEENCNP